MWCRGCYFFDHWVVHPIHNRITLYFVSCILREILVSEFVLIVFLLQTFVCYWNMHLRGSVSPFSYLPDFEISDLGILSSVSAWAAVAVAVTSPRLREFSAYRS